MDECSGKRAGHGLVDSSEGSGTLLRETSNNRDRNPQFYNRVGCSGRSNSIKGTQIVRAKPSRPSLCSPSIGKEKIGSSSTSCTVVRNPKKSSVGSLKKASQLETDSSETSRVHDEPRVSKLIPPPVKIQRGIDLDTKNGKTSELSSTKVGTSSVASNTRSQTNSHQRSGLLNKDASVGSSVCPSSKTAYQATHASGTRYGLRNMRSNSISDVVLSNSSSDFSLNRKREKIKKRNSEGENCSTAREKKINGSASENNPTSNHGISISDPGRAGNMLPNKDNVVASVRTRRSINSNARARLPNQGIGNSSSCNESHVASPQLSQPETVDMNVSGLSQPLSAETPAVRLNSLSRPGSSNQSLHTEVGLPHSLMNQDSLRCYNMDGIAEVLLALERIEHDEELTVEQMLVLETNMFISGLNFYDQHRDMRLDIDNMSYEELLALEERIGSVSTALPEDDLSKCLKRNIYQSIPPEGAGLGSSGDNDDVICSICQEEYVAGDEVGRLQCEHMYHVDCVHQWLRLKNWCPICKASASWSSPSPSPSP